MSPLTNDDDAMKALRAHSLQVGGIESANKSFDPSSDENQWFDSQEPSTAIERDDTEAWKRLKLGKDLRKLHYDLNGQRDIAAAAKIAGLNQKKSETKTSISQKLEVPKQVRFSAPGPSLTRENLWRHQLTQQNEMLTAAVSRPATVEVVKKQLEEANQTYGQAYSDNLMELEFGPSCPCNRYPWQHELHPSGTAKRGWGAGTAGG